MPSYPLIETQTRQITQNSQAKLLYHQEYVSEQTPQQRLVLKIKGKLGLKKIVNMRSQMPTERIWVHVANPTMQHCV